MVVSDRSTINTREPRHVLCSLSRSWSVCPLIPIHLRGPSLAAPRPSYPILGRGLRPALPVSCPVLLTGCRGDSSRCPACFGTPLLHPIHTQYRRRESARPANVCICMLWHLGPYGPWRPNLPRVRSGLARLSPGGRRLFRAPLPLRPLGPALCMHACMRRVSG